MKYIPLFEDFSNELKISLITGTRYWKPKIKEILAYYNTRQVVDYRDIHKQVTKDDYFISTNATFTQISKEEYDSIKSPINKSPKSDSEYKIYKDVVYRDSDHWGRVASCYWRLKNEDGEEIDGKYYGKCPLNKFKIIDTYSGYFDYLPDEQKKENLIKMLNDLFYQKRRNVLLQMDKKLKFISRKL